MKEKLNNLLETLKQTNREGYEEVRDILSFLNKERIKLIGNSLRQAFGRAEKEVSKEEVTQAVSKLNKLASASGIEFNVPTEWQYIDNFLRMTILEDIQAEFAKQNAK